MATQPTEKPLLFSIEDLRYPTSPVGRLLHEVLLDLQISEEQLLERHYQDFKKRNPTVTKEEYLCIAIYDYRINDHNPRVAEELVKSFCEKMGWKVNHLDANYKNVYLTFTGGTLKTDLGWCSSDPSIPDWRKYVGENVKSIWPKLSTEVRLAIVHDAQKLISCFN